MEKIAAKVSTRNISCGPVITSECMANSSKRMKRTRGCSMALIMMEFSNDVMDSMMVTWHTRMSVGPKIYKELHNSIDLVKQGNFMCVLPPYEPSWLVTQMVRTQMVV